MEAITFEEGATAPFKLVILIKEKHLDKAHLKNHYIDPLVRNMGMKAKDIVCVGLRYINNKALKDTSLDWFENNLIPILNKTEAKAIAIADSNYFYYITGNKSSSYIKSYCKSVFKQLKVSCVPIINYAAINHNIAMASKLTESLKVIPNAISGLPSDLGTRVVRYQYYPDDIHAIAEYLDTLLGLPEIAVDLETFGLDHREAGIGTISFSPDEDTCIAFKVQYQTLGERDTDLNIYIALRDFFVSYKGVLLFHRGSYDIKILVYELFMSHDEDYEGMVYGLKQFENIEDTMLMTYVCTNNTIQNVLNLKDNTLEFAGNYAIEVEDITIHEPSLVLEYNGRDTSNTMYLYYKYLDKLARENLSASYTILKDFILVGVQLEIRGFPMSIEHSKQLYEEVSTAMVEIEELILGTNIVKGYLEQLHKNNVWNYNLESKTRIVHVDTYPRPEFNINSDSQLGSLIHEHLGVDVVNTTDTGLPSMTTDSLIEMSHSLQKSNKELVLIVDALIEHKQVATNLNNFIKKFAFNTQQKDNGKGSHYLYGSIKLGTTISGRPTGGGTCNLLALPSTGSVLAKPVKKCFRAPEDRLMVGSDYSGQEDVAASIVSKDPEMLRGKILGIDGHSSRAVAYFPELLPEHTKKLEQAETASSFYCDDSKTGLDKFICK